MEIEKSQNLTEKSLHWGYLNATTEPLRERDNYDDHVLYEELIFNKGMFHLLHLAHYMGSSRESGVAEEEFPRNAWMIQIPL